jgi:hypothetical protein
MTLFIVLLSLSAVTSPLIACGKLIVANFTLGFSQASTVWRRRCTILLTTILLLKVGHGNTVHGTLLPPVILNVNVRYLRITLPPTVDMTGSLHPLVD